MSSSFRTGFFADSSIKNVTSAENVSFVGFDPVTGNHTLVGNHVHINNLRTSFNSAPLWTYLAQRLPTGAIWSQFYYRLNLIRFCWRVYKRRQRRKRAELHAAVEKGDVLYDLPLDVSRLIVSWY